MARNGKLDLSDLSPELRNQLKAHLSSPRKKPNASEPDVLLGAAAVMGALKRSKMPIELWPRVLSQCQRWCHNIDRSGPSRKRRRD